MWNTGKTLWAQQYILKALSCWNYLEWMLSVTPHFYTHKAHQKILLFRMMRFCVPYLAGIWAVRQNDVWSQIQTSWILCFIWTQIKSHSYLTLKSMLVGVSHSFLLNPHPRSMSSGICTWLWHSTTGKSCIALTSLSMCPPNSLWRGCWKASIAFGGSKGEREGKGSSSKKFSQSVMT